MCINIFTSTLLHHLFIFFFFNDTATTEIYTLSLHDALPISLLSLDTAWLTFPLFLNLWAKLASAAGQSSNSMKFLRTLDRKSTRLNSSHANISYAVFCLKKKKENSTLFRSCTLATGTAHTAH